MIDISKKNNTLRVARALAVVKVSSEQTIQAVQNNQVPKGDVFEMSKAAGLLGIKQTPYLLPDCHPLPIEQASIEYEIHGLEIHIQMQVKTIYKTGVEVEAMHGASVVALNIYDMLKPLDKGIEIHSIKLLEKSGGKSQFKDKHLPEIQAGVIVCSDTISAGQKKDRAGIVIQEKLKELAVDVVHYKVIPDEGEEIKKEVNSCVEQGIKLVIITGGTGLSSRDVTPETIIPMLDRRIPGIEEVIRSYGQQRMPYAMLSRSVVGQIRGSLIIALPGSSRGVAESLDAIFPHVLHVFAIMKDIPHS